MKKLISLLLLAASLPALAVNDYLAHGTGTGTITSTDVILFETTGGVTYRIAASGLQSWAQTGMVPSSSINSTALTALGAVPNATGGVLTFGAIGTNVQAYSATLGTLASGNPFTAGTNVSFGGTWPNITINATGGGGSLSIGSNATGVLTASSNVLSFVHTPGAASGVLLLDSGGNIPAGLLGNYMGVTVQAYNANLTTLAASNPFTAGTGISFSGTWPNITVASTVVGGVSSFNTRTGAIALTAADVNALSGLTVNTTGSAGSLSSTLVVGQGGTGLTSIPSGDIMIGNGSSAPTLLSMASSVQTAFPNAVDTTGGLIADVAGTTTIPGALVVTGATTLNGSISGIIQLRNGSGAYGGTLTSGEMYLDTTNWNFYGGNGTTNTLLAGNQFFRGFTAATAGSGAAGTPGAAGTAPYGNTFQIYAGNGGNTVTAGSVGGNGGSISSYPLQVTAGNGGAVASGGTGTGGAGGSLSFAPIIVTAGSGGAAGGTSTTGVGGAGTSYGNYIIAITGGNGGNAGTTGNGGAATSLGGINPYVLHYVFGNGGNGAGANSGGAAGSISVTNPVEFATGAGGAAYSGGSVASGGTGGGWPVAPLQVIGGNGGNVYIGGGYSGGNGGNAGGFSANGGNGGNGTSSSAGAAGGAAGFLNLNGSNASTTTAGAAGGSISLQGVTTVPGGSITLSNSVNTMTTSGSTQYTITIPAFQNATLMAIHALTSGSSSFTANIGVNVFNGSTASQIITLPTPSGQTTPVFIKNLSSVSVTVTSASGSQIMASGSATAAASITLTTGQSALLFSDGTYWDQ